MQERLGALWKKRLHRHSDEGEAAEQATAPAAAADGRREGQAPDLVTIRANGGRTWDDLLAEAIEEEAPDVGASPPPTTPVDTPGDTSPPAPGGGAGATTGAVGHRDIEDGAPAPDRPSLPGPTATQPPDAPRQVPGAQAAPPPPPRSGPPVPGGPAAGVVLEGGRRVVRQRLDLDGGG